MTSNNLVKTILILLVAKLSGTVNITAYNFENILSSTTFALKGSKKCDLSTVNQIIVEKGALVYTELGHTKLRYCMYKAAYTVTAMKRSNWWDDASFLSAKSEIIPVLYSITSKLCREIWEGKTVFIPGFADFKFSVEKETLAKPSNSGSNIEYSKQISRTFTPLFGSVPRVKKF